MSWTSGQRDRNVSRPGAGTRELELIDLVGGMLRLPLAMLTVGVEMALRTLWSIQKATEESVEQASGRVAAPVVETVAPAFGGTEGPRRAGEPGPAAPIREVQPAAREAAANQDSKERRAMGDHSLGDDRVKLVRYTIVSIKRDAEQILHRDEEIFDDAMSDDAFATWVISKYGSSSGMSMEDRKYLRVSYEVLGHWPRQDRKYEKRQLEALEGIREAMQ